MVGRDRTAGKINYRKGNEVAQLSRHAPQVIRFSSVFSLLIAFERTRVCVCICECVCVCVCVLSQMAKRKIIS